MFHNFDEDGSGIIDSNEIIKLYNLHDIPIDSDSVLKLYGKNISFTLDKFIKITANREDLSRYFKHFKKIKKLMLARAFPMRQYMPTTFDETMVEIGFKLDRQNLLDQLGQLLK